MFHHHDNNEYSHHQDFTPQRRTVHTKEDGKSPAIVPRRRQRRCPLFGASTSKTVCLLLFSFVFFDTMERSHSFLPQSNRYHTTQQQYHPQPLPSFINQNTSSSSSSSSSSLAMIRRPSDIDTTEDPRLYRIRIPRAPGIEWGTDLSFSFVYVRSMEPSGPAQYSGMVSVGDQICELRPVRMEDYEMVDEGEEGGEEVMGEDDGLTVPLIGSPFDAVMNGFAALGPTIMEVDLVFFRGTKEELIQLCNSSNGDTTDDDSNKDPNTITITVITNPNSPTESTQQITAPKGANVRQVLVDSGINVYQSLTRWTNCEGKQLCGTCIVNVAKGNGDTNRKSMDEESTLRENPDGYRLACVTFAYGDVTVETFPPIKAAQWTR